MWFILRSELFNCMVSSSIAAKYYYVYIIDLLTLKAGFIFPEVLRLKRIGNLLTKPKFMEEQAALSSYYS